MCSHIRFISVIEKLSHFNYELIILAHSCSTKQFKLSFLICQIFVLSSLICFVKPFKQCLEIRSKSKS